MKGIISPGLVSKIVLYTVSGLAIILPSFFLPLTLDVLEVPKHFLLYGVTLVLLLLFVLDRVSSRIFSIKKSPFAIAIAGYAVVLLIASFFSVDVGMSFLGDYSSLQITSLAFLFLGLLYFLLVEYVETKQQTLMLASSVGIGIVLALALFVVASVVPIVFAYLNTFSISNTVSLSNAEFGYLLSAVLIAVLSYISLKQTSLRVFIAGLVIAIVFFGMLVSFGFTPVYISLVVGLLFVLSIALTHPQVFRGSLVTGMFSMLTVVLLLLFIGTPAMVKRNLPVEISLGISESGYTAYQTLTSSIKDFVLGSGPTTFSYAFALHRPSTINASSVAWNLHFSKPQSTFFSVITETGILGLLGFSGIILLVAGYIFAMLSTLERRKGELLDKEELPLFLALSSALMVIASSFFLGHAGIVSWFIFIITIALLATMILRVTGSEPLFSISLKTSPQYSFLYSFGLVLSVSFAIVALVFGVRFYLAEYYYAQGVLAGDSKGALQNFSKAVTYYQRNPRYHLGLAQAYLQEAKRIATTEKEPPQELISSLVAQAVNTAKTATSIIPENGQAWSLLADMYSNARPFAQGIDVWLEGALDKAVEFEPLSPQLRVRLGLLKLQLGKKSEAKDHMIKAIELKQDYLDGYVGLAQVLESENKIDDAVTELQKGMVYGGQSDSVYLFHVGRILYNRNKGDDFKISEQAFRASIAANPKNVNALYALAVLLDKKGAYKEALDMYKSVWKLDQSQDSVRKRITQLESIVAN